MRFFAGPCSGIQSGGWDAKGGNREDTAPSRKTLVLLIGGNIHNSLGYILQEKMLMEPPSLALLMGTLALCVGTTSGHI